MIGAQDNVPRFLHTQYVQTETEWKEGGRVVLLGLEFPEVAFQSDSGPTLHQLFFGWSRKIEFHPGRIGWSAQFNSLLNRECLSRGSWIPCLPFCKVLLGAEEDHVVRACIDNVIPPFGG